MDMRRYKHERDYETLCEWYRKRNLTAPRYLPETGLVIDGVAMGFVNLADGYLAILGGLIADPRVRHKSLALDRITKGLIKIAKLAGKKRILAMTKSDRVVKLAKQNGLQVLPHVCLGSAI